MIKGVSIASHDVLIAFKDITLTIPTYVIIFLSIFMVILCLSFVHELFVGTLNVIKYYIYRKFNSIDAYTNKQAKEGISYSEQIKNLNQQEIDINARVTIKHKITKWMSNIISSLHKR